MAIYKVWDDESETIECASDFEAGTAGDAARIYAEEDVDGASDGYYDNGRRIGVQDKNGKITKWEVTVEYDPTYYATPARGEPL